MKKEKIIESRESLKEEISNFSHDKAQVRLKYSKITNNGGWGEPVSALSLEGKTSRKLR